MGPLKIKISNDFVPEKEYVLDFIFRDVLGVEYDLITEDRNDYLIELPNGRSITLIDYFFRNAESEYIKAENIPEDVKMLSCGEVSEIPVIFGSDQMFINEKSIKCGFDIVATIFFMLSRWEEIAITEKDEHGRFPGKLSLAVKGNFIDRPIVNEYVLIVMSFIEELDPSVAMKEQESKITLTSDIDDFRKYHNFNIFKKLAGDLVKTIGHNSHARVNAPWQYGENGAYWNLINENNQAVVSGIYLFSVQDVDSDYEFVGKFVIIK